jgi:hypothetical protein
MGVAALGVVVVAILLYRVVWFARRERRRRLQNLLWFKPGPHD